MEEEFTIHLKDVSKAFYMIENFLKCEDIIILDHHGWLHLIDFLKCVVDGLLMVLCTIHAIILHNGGDISAADYREFLTLRHQMCFMLEWFENEIAQLSSPSSAE